MTEELKELNEKAKRKYTKKPVPPPPPPVPAVNPTIVAMESKIGELVEQRAQAQYQISVAEQAFLQAQSMLKRAQDMFSRIEQEIQYRMNLINQMRGGAPMPPPLNPGVAVSPYWQGSPPAPMSPSYAPAAPYPTYPPQFDPRTAVQADAFGRASIPAPNLGLYADVGGTPEGAQTASAESVRMEEMRLRGY